MDSHKLRNVSGKCWKEFQHRHLRHRNVWHVIKPIFSCIIKFTTRAYHYYDRDGGADEEEEELEDELCTVVQILNL